MRSIDSLPEALLAFDSSGVVMWASSATFDVLGWHPDELVGQPITVVTLEANADQQRQILEDVRRTGRSVTFSTQRRRRDGGVIEVSVSVEAIRDARTGEFVGHCASVRDTTRHTGLRTQLAQQVSLSAELSRRSSDVALIANADTEITFVSPSAVDVLGYTPDQLVGSKGLGLVHEDDVAGVQAFVNRVASRPGEVERMTFRIANPQGEWRWIEETLSNCMDVPGVQGLVANIRDVTGEVEARAAIAASEHRYRTIVETAQEGVLVLGHDARVLFANSKAAEMLGHPREQLDRRKLTGFVGHTAGEPGQQVASGAPGGHVRYEITYPHPDGGRRIFEIAASPISLDDQGATGSLAMVSDVTDARRIGRELQHRALHDALTGLPNRALLNDRLSMALSRQKQQPDHPSLAVLSVDLDGFRLINDVHGHEFGDAILVEVARRLSDASRPADTVARLGGDEFIVVAEGVEVDAARALAGRLRTSLLEPMVAQGTTVYMDASVGVALSLPATPSSLLRCADAAMCQAKSQGRGRVHIYDAASDTDTGRQLQLANALRQALDSDQLTLGYQPIVDLTHGRVVEVEALLRWEHPDLGRVSPPEVIATAHAIGLAERLDQCVLQRACTDMAHLRGRGAGTDITLAVNLCAQSVEGSTLPQMVSDTGRVTGWPLDQLTLELTEGVLMSDTDAAAVVLTRLRELDVSIAIDDFGTGYSSLAYLQRLPVATVKVDRSFVEHVPVDPESCSIVRSIIDLARALALTTVAEGIETPEQADYMRRLGCTRGQGHLWSPAVSPTELEVLLRAWPADEPAAPVR